MEQDPTRMCELLVGLGEVDVLGVDDELSGPLVVHVRTRCRPVCWGCGGAGVVQGHRCGAAGGFAGVQAPGAVGVAQVAFALPRDGFVP